MRKILVLIAAMIMYNAYGEVVYWMADNSVSSVNDCNTGDNITKPSNPTKTGYKFIGWKEDDTSFIAQYVTNNGTSYTPTVSAPNDTWTTTFSWGTVTGKARCSSISGTETCYNDSTGASCTKNANPTTTDTTPNNGVINYSGSADKYCWCKMTDFAGASVSSLAWVYLRSPGSTSSCVSYCTGASCGNYVKSYSGFRRAVFGL